MTFKELKSWYKKNKQGFYTVEYLKNFQPDVLEAFEKELNANSGKVGCYVYHYHTLTYNKFTFDRMKVGYYVRSKNPFSWKFKRTYGNH